MRKCSLVLSAFAAIALAVGCGKNSQPPAENVSAATNEVRSYPTRGLVREVADDSKTIVVRHEEIPGYMPKMTMELTVKDPDEVRSLVAGDIITFNLVVDSESHHIENVQRVGTSSETQKNAATVQPPLSELGPGDAMPSVALVDENGKAVNLLDFQGKAVAFTFIFSRCPLPDYCPRMNKHFLRAREILQADKLTTTNWQLLSISFDPEFDTPPVLKRYGDSYRGGSSDRWLFAAISPEVLTELAPRLDFRFSREGGSFSHNLRTVVLDTNSRIFKQFDNNLWTAEELASAIAEAAKVPQS